MNDVIVPQNDVIRRPVVVPEPYMIPPREDNSERIEKNPFFERPLDKKTNLTKKTKRKGVLWALLFVLFLFIGFEVANYFATATIEIAPVTRNVILNNTLKAVKTPTADELRFDSMSLTEEKTKEVPLTIEKQIQTKASGKVVIYNAYSAQSQRLIKNTRFEDEKTRKIYHIDESVVVPGTRIVDGKIIPGSVDAVVYAARVGKEYNIGTSNFTIPGFKGDPRYSKFRAVSKPDWPIKGGLDEVRKVPSDEAVKTAQEELKQDLKKIVVEKARANIQADKTFFPGSVIIKFEEVPQDFSVGSPSNVSVRGTVSVFFFKTTELVAKLSALTLPEDNGNPFYVRDMSTLTFTFVDQVNNVVLDDLSEINFQISGEVNFVGKVDKEKMLSELLGKDKKEFAKIIDNQINIKSATPIIRPIWKSVFPSDPAKITVKIISK